MFKKLLLISVILYYTQAYESYQSYIYKIALLLVKDCFNLSTLIAYSINYVTINEQEANFSQATRFSDKDQGIKPILLSPRRCKILLASARGVCPSFCFLGKLLHSCEVHMSTFTLTLHHIPHYLPTPWINSEFQERAYGWHCWVSCPSLSHSGRAAHI